MCVRFIAALLLPWLTIIPTSARAGPAAPARVVSISHGVRLTLVVPRHTYPRNSLAWVTVRVQNISPHPVSLLKPCDENLVGAEVINAAGQAVYPPALRTSLPLSCPPAVPRSLMPGAHLTRHVLALFRTPRLRAAVSLAGGTVTGRAIMVPLTKGHAPHVSLQTSPDVALRVRAASRERSTPLLAKSWGYCEVADPAGSVRSGSETGWIVVHRAQGGGYVVRPDIGPDGGCRQPIEWHVVVGFPGQPVACADFVNPNHPREGLPALSGSACTDTRIS